MTGFSQHINIDDDQFTKAEAIEAYNLTVEQFDKYEPVYRKTINN